MLDTLTPKLRSVVTRVVEEEGEKRRHLVVSLCGPHAHGFAPPDGDLTLRAIHVEDTARLIGDPPPPLHADRLAVMAGVEVDYTSNEVGSAVTGILGGNGTYLERILGPQVAESSLEHQALRTLARGALSQRLHAHYHRFARIQLQSVNRTVAPTGASVLFVLHTALTGVHLLLEGRLDLDLGRLVGRYGFEQAEALMEAHLEGQRVRLSPSEAETWTEILSRSLTLLDDARHRSPLPEHPANEHELAAWLIELRRLHL